MKSSTDYYEYKKRTSTLTVNGRELKSSLKNKFSNY